MLTFFLIRIKRNLTIRSHLSEINRNGLVAGLKPNDKYNCDINIVLSIDMRLCNKARLKSSPFYEQKPPVK